MEGRKAGGRTKSDPVRDTAPYCPLISKREGTAVEKAKTSQRQKIGSDHSLSEQLITERNRLVDQGEGLDNYLRCARECRRIDEVIPKG